MSFFNLSYQRLIQRIKEVEEFYPSLLSSPFDFSINEEINLDFENISFSKNNNERRERWRKQLKYSALDIYDIKISEQKLNIEKDKDYKVKLNEEIIKESIDLVSKNINNIFDLMNDLQRKDWFSNYLNSFVIQLDPHTFYFKPEDKERFDMNISGKFNGIGARLSKQEGGIKIVDIILGGPLWKDKKIEIGDEIIKVGQANEEPVDVIGMRLEDAIKLIKGPKDTEVRLTIRKKIDGEIKVVPVIRDLIRLEETYAKSTIIKKDDNKYGLISLPKFYVDFDNYKTRNCASDVKKEIIKLKKEGIKGLVLDLRNNGGGSLQTVVDAAEYHFGKGLWVSTHRKKAKAGYTTCPGDWLGDWVENGMSIVEAPDAIDWAAIIQFFKDLHEQVKKTPLSRPSRSRGLPVRLVQGKLAERGFNPGPVDGVYGKKTGDAIREFQKTQGFLKVTGVVNGETFGCLFIQ